MTDRAQPAATPAQITRPATVEIFGRGNGVASVPYFGKWAKEHTTTTAGTTTLRPCYESD